MRCVSVPDGRPAKPISNTDLQACAKRGHMEYESLPRTK
jgi:hypothetical protein